MEQSSSREMDLFTPTEEHGALRDMLAGFVKTKVDPQALKHDREEKFNVKLFRELGNLGLLGLTAPEKFVLYLFHVTFRVPLVF